MTNKTAALTGFDLFIFAASGMVNFDLSVDAGEGSFDIFVSDELAVMLTEQTGITITTEQLQNIYVKFAEILGGTRLEISESEEGGLS